MKSRASSVKQPVGSWTCTTCNRRMDERSKDEHLAGKPHSKEVAKLAQTISSSSMSSRGGASQTQSLSPTSSNNNPVVNTNSPASMTKPGPRKDSNQGERRQALSDYSPLLWQEARMLYMSDLKHKRQTESLPLLDGESDIKGWRAIVTGANTGIGYEVAKGLLLRGIRTVVLACRNESKGRAAAEALLTETGREWGAVEFRYLDLASFASVRAFAKKYIHDRLPLHVLVHNAGVHGIGCKVMTEDGLDLLMQVNHISPLMLTLLLLRAMFGSAWRFLPPKTARVIWVTSDEAELVPFPEAALHRPVTALCTKKLATLKDELEQYATAKLLNIMCARELLQRLFLVRTELTGSVRVAAAHPGCVGTELGRKDMEGNVVRAEAADFRGSSCHDIALRTPEEGAKTVLLVASYRAQEIWGQEGYGEDIQSMPVFENMEVMWAYPPLAHSLDLRNNVWVDTLRLMGLKEGEVDEIYL